MHPLQDQCDPCGEGAGNVSRLTREHAHAFKNIFSIILANKAMIAEEGDGEALLRRRLERIETACQRGEHLVATLQSEEPSSQVAPVATTPARGATEDARLQARVMVVDDEPDMVEIVRRYLLTEGLDVQGTSDSLQAIELLANPSFLCDLVVTDLDMPFCDGMELCRRLQTLRPDLPVVVMTGYGKSLAPNELQQLHVSALLCKPVERRLLVATIRRLLSA